VVEQFGDKINKNNIYKGYFSTYFYKYEGFVRTKQIEVANPEDSPTSMEDSNYITWKNNIDPGLENENEDDSDSGDMFTHCEPSANNNINKNYGGNNFNNRKDNPEELLDFLRKHVEDEGKEEIEKDESGLEVTLLGKKLLDPISLGYGDIGEVNENPKKHWKL